MIENFSKNLFTVSNLLSFMRLLIAVPLWFMLPDIGKTETRIIVMILIFIGAVTDFLDGYLARKLNQVSELGKIIDPLADKISVAIVAVRLYGLGMLNPWLFWAIILRDILIVAGGIYISGRIKNVTPSNMVGKITVTIIAFYLVGIMLGATPGELIHDILLYSSFSAIIISFSIYTYTSLKKLKDVNIQKH
ncbi:MAG: CDP-alcohol phosphatidyltransferase family protein [Ignavibacteriaceae bacterium]|nr:CDP-alcohol phosphatidyltransferase family protein [Ignavibacteriaceae bacterium]NUM71881.1 CDP-alcohol phosphatidyltransferase family protein [Ignavibacteriaceae bacterium]